VLRQVANLLGQLADLAGDELLWRPALAVAALGDQFCYVLLWCTFTVTWHFT
jgi:hypothetical protein